MLQKYNISTNMNDNLLSIKEFAVLGNISKKGAGIMNPDPDDYYLTFRISIDIDKLRNALLEGKEALISQIRSKDFFPIRPLAEIIADKVTEMMDTGDDQSEELFFDDRSLLAPREETK